MIEGAEIDNTYVLLTIEKELNKLIGLYSKHEEVPKMPLYNMLALVQESLGEDLERVIHENLWELYES